MDTASSSAVTVGRQRKHQFMLMFHAGNDGVAKRVELGCIDASPAIELALRDRFRRVVDIWEDGEFLCRISRERTIIAKADYPSSR